MDTSQQSAVKLTNFMSDLQLKEGKDFKVIATAHNRITVQLNTGHDTKSYRKGLEQQLKGTGHILTVENAELYVRPAKVAKSA